MKIHTDQIKLPKKLIRTDTLDSEDGLGFSIQKKGLIHHIVVAQKNGNYELICGYRRLKEARKLGMEEIEADVRENVSPMDRDILMLEENVRRRSLSSLEVAEWVCYMLSEHNLSYAQLGKEIGMSPEQVSKYAQLSHAPSDVKDLLRDKRTDMDSAVRLSSLERWSDRRGIVNAIRTSGANQEQVSAWVMDARKKQQDEKAVREAMIRGELDQPSPPPKRDLPPKTSICDMCGQEFTLEQLKAVQMKVCDKCLSVLQGANEPGGEGDEQST